MTDRTLLWLPERLDALVFALPAVAALAASGRRLSALVTPPLEPLAELLPGVVETLEELDLPPRGAGPLPIPRFSEAVLLSPGLPPAWTTFRAGIPSRWGYGGGLRRWLLAPAVAPPKRAVRDGRHASEDFRELLAAMHLPAPEEGVPRLELPETLRLAGRKRLARAQLTDREGPWVGLIPGGWLDAVEGRRSNRLGSAARRWPWPRFVELARALRQAVAGLRCVLVAGQENLWPAVRIHEETGRIHPLIGPDLDAAGIAGLFGHLDLAVGADSELLHLAAATGLPTVALFGPTDPRRRAPRGGPAQRVEAPGGNLRALAMEPVLRGCLELLAEPPAG